MKNTENQVIHSLSEAGGVLDLLVKASHIGKIFIFKPFTGK
jgi:hypothetical protein